MSLAGSVSVDSVGVATGGGLALALALYSAMLALPSYGFIPSGAPGVLQKRGIADVCNTFGLIADGPRWLPTSRSSNYVAQASDFVICTAAITVTLPDPTTQTSGAAIIVKAMSGSTGVVVAGGTLIDGSFTSPATQSPDTSKMFITNGALWYEAAVF